MNLIPTLMLLGWVGLVIFACLSFILLGSNDLCRADARTARDQRDRALAENAGKNHTIIALHAENQVLHAIVRGEGKHAPKPVSLILVPDTIASLDDYRGGA